MLVRFTNHLSEKGILPDDQVDFVTLKTPFNEFKASYIVAEGMAYAKIPPECEQHKIVVIGLVSKAGNIWAVTDFQLYRDDAIECLLQL